ncbi:MAG: LuxR C-terminal-related transcriptional regulator [Planctomycetota bacterium]|nr:LuxR C-terminal-related transcriptional regulator [Planctomycetota bacterium]
MESIPGADRILTGKIERSVPFGDVLDRRPTSQEIAGSGIFSTAQWKTIAVALGLSSREYQIVRLLFDDEKEYTIALRLGLSRHTVHTYIERLYRKIGVNSRTQLCIKVFSVHLDATGEYVLPSCTNTHPTHQAATRE